MALLFTDIPPELVDTIISTICRCNPTLSCIPTCIDHVGQGCLPCDPDRRAALKSLCLTSRRLYSLALPHLYHQLALNNHAEWWLLARTLAERPEIGSHARSLCFLDHQSVPEHVRDKLRREPSLVNLFVDLRDKYLATCSVSSSNSSTVAPRELEEQAVTFDTFLDSEYNLPVDFLTSLLPNLETLSVQLVSGFALFKFCAPRSLPRLRDVRLAYSSFWDAMHMSAVARVFAAAQDSLERVVLLFYPVISYESQAILDDDDVAGPRESESEPESDSASKLEESYLQPVSPRVTHLTIMHPNFTRNVVRELFVMFPNITHLRFTMGGPRPWHLYRQPSLTEIIDFFRSPEHATRLVDLTLVISGCFSQWRQWWNMDDVREFQAVMEARGARVSFRP
jgi:hypothetical protein